MAIEHNQKVKEKQNLIQTSEQKDTMQMVNSPLLNSQKSLEEQEQQLVQPVAVEDHMQEQIQVVQNLQQNEEQEEQQEQEEDLHIAFERKYAEARGGDKRMAAVREALKRYYDVPVHSSDEQIEALHGIIDQCKAYCKGRIKLWGRGKQRLQAVKKFRQEAEKKLSGLINPTGLNYIHNKADMYTLSTGQTARAVVGGILSIFSYVPHMALKMGLKTLMAPARLINYGIRKWQMSQGKPPVRMLASPKLYGPISYAKMAARTFAGVEHKVAGSRSLGERFFEHHSDFATMDRADMETDMLMDPEYEDYEMSDEEREEIEQAQDNEMNNAVVYDQPRRKTKSRNA